MFSSSRGELREFSDEKLATDSSQKCAERVNSYGGIYQKDKEVTQGDPFVFLVDPTGVEPVSENLLI